MKFKRTFIEKIFRIKKTCYAGSCNHIFKDGDDYEVEDLLFAGFVFVCKPCHKKFLKELERVEKEKEKQKLDKKRADYKILAEEIVKIMKINN